MNDKDKTAKKASDSMEYHLHYLLHAREEN